MYCFLFFFFFKGGLLESHQGQRSNKVQLFNSVVPKQCTVPPMGSTVTLWESPTASSSWLSWGPPSWITPNLTWFLWDQGGGAWERQTEEATVKEGGWDYNEFRSRWLNPLSPLPFLCSKSVQVRYPFAPPPPHPHPNASPIWILLQETTFPFSKSHWNHLAHIVSFSTKKTHIIIRRCNGRVGRLILFPFN